MTPIDRAAQALALTDSGVDCWDNLDDAMRDKLRESVRAVLGAVREADQMATEAGARALALADCSEWDSAELGGVSPEAYADQNWSEWKDGAAPAFGAMIDAMLKGGGDE